MSSVLCLLVYHLLCIAGCDGVDTEIERACEKLVMAFNETLHSEGFSRHLLRARKWQYPEQQKGPIRVQIDTARDASHSGDGTRTPATTQATAAGSHVVRDTG